MTPDQDHPKYIVIMLLGPLGLLHILCSEGGPHPCLGKLLKNPRFDDVLERLFSFIARVPAILGDGETSPEICSGFQIHMQALEIARSVLSPKGDKDSLLKDIRPLAGAPAVNLSLRLPPTTLDLV